MNNRSRNRQAHRYESRAGRVAATASCDSSRVESAAREREERGHFTKGLGGSALGVLGVVLLKLGSYIRIICEACKNADS